ncbi:MAG TPA: enoyl-CoA hydratase-related protein [Mycobacteriales bacterium]|nr:enoyl-CoA hydratase-related protein [Mycobacteriales bacterium]
MVAGIEDVRLTRRLPLGSVLRLALMGRAYRMTAERAYQLGLVDELVAPDELIATAGEMAAVLARNSPAAMSLTQQGIWRSLDTGLTEASEYAWALVRMHWGHPDFREGPRAYAEKRAPQWAPPG